MKKALGNSGYIGADKRRDPKGIIIPFKPYCEVLDNDWDFLPYDIPPQQLVYVVDTSIAGSTGIGKFKVNIHNADNLFDVDWGDGSKDLAQTADITHTYSSSGTFLVKITGRLYPYWASDTDGDKIIEIRNLGRTILTGTYRSYYLCHNLDYTSRTEIPTIDGLSWQGMFRGCTALKGNQSTMGQWKISNATSLFNMFYGCSNFDTDLGDWDVENYTGTFSGLFYGCSKFNNGGSPSIGDWDITGVTSLQDMFYACNEFDQNLGSWDISNLTSLQQVFYSAQKFNNGGSDSIKDWNTSGITSLYRTFRNCQGFNQPIGSWDIGNVTSLYDTFYNCVLFNQPLNNWDISSVTTMIATFYGCDVFDQPLNNWSSSMSTTNNCQLTFAYCDVFNQDIGSWDVSNITTMNQMFYAALRFNNGGTGSIDSWNTSNVDSFYRMFRLATDFNQPIGSWDVSNVTTMYEMFHGATSFDQDIQNWDVSNVESMYGMFYGASDFNQPLIGWSSSISNCSNMAGMFQDADSFNQDVGSWDMSNVTTMQQMFYANNNFNNGGTGSIDSWDLSSCTSLYRVFRACPNFNQPIGGWTLNTSSNVTVYEMLYDCDSFDQSLAGWNISKINNATQFMAYSTGLSTANYDETLEAWGAQSGSVISGVSINFGGSKYTSGSLANQMRTKLEDAGWSFTDGGYAP